MSCKLVIILLIFFILFISCRRHKEEIKLSQEKAFLLAKESFNKKKWDKSIEQLKNFIFHYPGSKYSEEAQFLLAKAYFNKNDWANAQIQYEFFIKMYPRSYLCEEAEFDLCVCYFNQSPPYYLDQSLTYQTLNKFNEFIEKYPKGKFIENAKKYKQKCIDKLVKKDLETAKLYLKMGKKDAALIYLDDIQKNFENNSYTKEIDELIRRCK